MNPVLPGKDWSSAEVIKLRLLSPENRKCCTDQGIILQRFAFPPQHSLFKLITLNAHCLLIGWL